MENELKQHLTVLMLERRLRPQGGANLSVYISLTLTCFKGSSRLSSTKMSSAQPPQYPGKVTIALFGKNPDLVRWTGSAIIGGFNASVTEIGNLLKSENHFYRIISTSDFFDLDCDHTDQLIIDFMALCDPGPRLFILAIDSKNAQVEKVVSQISRLQDEFGKDVTKNIVIVLENWESYNLRSRIEEMYNIQMVAVNENLAVRCKEWCSYRRSFQFLYNNYPHHIVRRRKDYFMRTRPKQSYPGEPHQSSSSSRCAPERSTHNSYRQPWPAEMSPRTTGQSHHSFQWTAPPVEGAPAQDHGASGSRNRLFNMVLLGNSGTGKSASANTILAAGKLISGSGQHFPSYPSSTPVTTKCEEKIVDIFGTRVRVVDTPDFFYEERVDRAQVEECKKYCQEGQCVVLLVIQLGRFTDGERGILEKLEKHLGWKVRDNTIVLFTHGEDLKGSVDKFIGDRNHLKHIMGACGHRYHVFRNSSKDSKQLKALLKRFPDMFPEFPTIGAPGMSCLRFR